MGVQPPHLVSRLCGGNKPVMARCRASVQIKEQVW